MESKSKKDSSEMERVSVLFEGHVQGVGFRFTVARLAAHRQVTGYVRNEYDGNVTLEAEGLQEELMQLLLAVRQSAVGRFIIKEHISWRPATGAFSSFEVRY